MNNEQFRKLLIANAAKSSKDGDSAGTSTPAGGSTLGSRQRSSIPMTPRSLGGGQNEFARQLAERNNATRPQRKFKSMVPRGVKLGSGYVDRTKDREEEPIDDREERLKALEELVKNEEIDQATFEKLRFEIAGGDLSSTHLVKGLDFKLLDKIKRGEDVYAEKQEEPEKEPESNEPDEDVDDEFDQLEGQEVQAISKEKNERKKGQLSTISLAPGKKRTRDQILAELKAAREAAKAQQNLLGDRFKKVGSKQMPGSRIERDSKGREVLIIVDEDGHEKRKVRKLQPGQQKDEEDRSGLLMPDKNVKPLGMEVPEQYKKKEEPEEEEDIDIFDGVGDDYDPLAGMDGSDSDSDVDEKDDSKVSKDKKQGEVAGTSMPPPPRPAASQNYFKDAKTGLVSEEERIKAPSMSDPAIMAAFKRAAAMNPIAREKGDSGDEDEDEDTDKAKAMEERRKKLLQLADRDDADLDMGFGTSRFEDEEDFEDSKIKLSTWGDEGDDGAGKSNGARRKRGPKKRKGDANNAADVLRVMEQRKKAS
ncbi:Fc.00g063870.m01.CDS01 [Cosmosporella sp. VM-42]